jgi:xylulokinase
MTIKLGRVRRFIQEKFVHPAFLGLDLGASGLKAVIISATGEAFGAATVGLATRLPHPGWSEQDPADWLAAMRAAIGQALRAAGLAPAAITAIGITAGAHTPVLTGADGAVLRPAIMWSDQRAGPQAAALHARAGPAIIATGMNRVNPTWTLAMLAWLRAHEPHVTAATHRLYLAKDYLRAALTGTWETDASDAAGTLLADQRTGTWSPALCDLIGWDIATLPPIRPAIDIVGYVRNADFGLHPGTPVICGAMDTTTELFGAGALYPGQATIKLATAGVVCEVTTAPVVQPPVSCYPHIEPGLFYTAAGTNSCASALRWLRDTLNLPSFAAIDEAAAAAPPGAGGLLFHPYLQGERAPYWDADLRADFIGLTMAHSAPHMCRAVLEGVAFSLADVIAANPRPVTGPVRLLGGGAASPLWRQIIADVTGLTLAVPAGADAAFGAALLAALGTGAFASPAEAVARCVHIAATTIPNGQNAKRYNEMFDIYRRAQAALAPISHDLAAAARPVIAR